MPPALPSPCTRLPFIVAALLAALCAPPAAAIVTDSGGLPTLPADLNLGGVGLLSNGCSSALLAGGAFVLASAHCAAQRDDTVSFLGGTVVATIDKTFYAPGWDGNVNDLTLSRLTAPVAGVAGYALGYSASVPIAVVLAGYGSAGAGASGASGQVGALRYGFNDYEGLLADDPDGMPPAFYNGTVVAFDFDDGSAANNRFGSSGGSGEAMVAPSDSGGPSFAFVGGAWQVVGVHWAVDDALGFGFGGVGFDVLVSPYQAWIGEVTAVPEPGAAALMLAGLLGVAAAAKRRRR